MRRFFHSPVIVFVTGLLILILGLTTAVLVLPEWKIEPLPAENVFRSEANEARRELGMRVLDDFQIELTEQGLSGDNPQSEREQLERFLGDGAPAWLEENDRTFYVNARAQAENGEGKALSIEFRFTLDAKLVRIFAIPNGIGMGLLRGTAMPGLETDQIVSLLIREGEVLGEEESIGFFGSDLLVYPVTDENGDFVESIRIVNAPGFPFVSAERIPATTEQIDAVTRDLSIAAVLRNVWGVSTRVAFGIGLVALIVALAAQRSLGLRNGLILGAVQFVLVIPPVIRGQQNLVQTIGMDLLFLASAFVMFVGWSAAESWYRILSDEPTTGVDHLRERVLGNAEGRSLIAGWGVGAAISGVMLMIFAAAFRLEWLSATTSSVDISAMFHPRNPWFSGIIMAIAILLPYGVGARWLPANQRTPAALLLSALLIVPIVGLSPLPVAVVISAAVAGALMFALQVYGLLGLLVSSLMMFSIPVAAFATIHPRWQPFEFLVAGALVAVPVIVGFVGLGRRQTERRERIATPTFLRRIEHEKRLRYEMDLLARMQLGLLPNEPPSLKGWEIAVRSVLPTEVGGDFYEFIEDEEGCLWVGMGDVSGHGYQCSIVHAMTKSGLLSLVSGHRRPAEIMNRLDQVLRHSGTARTFVALALMRINLSTGEIDFSNAASPYPVVVTSDDTREIEYSTLPLGHGPIQQYENHRFSMEPGSAIVFWSDGLYEARNPMDDEYGYDRPSSVALSNVAESANAIMEAIFADWNRFRSTAEVEDDTTVLVIKRKR